MTVLTAPDSDSIPARAGGTTRDWSRLKAWIVDVFAEVDRKPVWAVIAAKIIHRFRRGFRSA